MIEKERKRTVELLAAEEETGQPTVRRGEESTGDNMFDADSSLLCPVVKTTTHLQQTHIKFYNTTTTP